MPTPNPNSPITIFLLTGHRKSGTTLLHSLFDSHASLNVYPVDISLLYAFVPCRTFSDNPTKRVERINKIIRTTLANRGDVTSPHSTAPFSPDHFLDFLWSRTDPSAFSDRASILSTMANVWCDYFSLDRTKPFVFKETSQSIHTLTLRNSIPGFRCVHIVRDPRDNFAAIKAGVPKYYAALGEDARASLASHINRARMDLLAAHELATTHAAWFHAVQFEDLAKSPDTTMKKLAGALALPYCESLTEPTKSGTAFTGNSFRSGRWSGVSDENVGNWSNSLTRAEVGVIEYWLADAMACWKYPRSLPTDDAIAAFSGFYDWYNCKYFFSDSFNAT